MSTPELRATRDQVQAFRLDSHNLAARLPAARLPAGSLALVAGACGVQNTPPGSAGLALRARLAGLSPGEVTAALEDDRILLQAWSLRAAPHVFPTGDAAVFTLGLLPEDEDSIRAFIYGVEAALEKTGITAVELVERTMEALLTILDGRAMTKDELGVELAQAISPKLSPGQLKAWRMPSWYAPGQSLGESAVRFALPIAALYGMCCHAERRGNKAYLRRTDQWLGAPMPEENRVGARAELVRRYLHCYGPSSVQGFAGWAGIGLAQAERAWKLAEAELVPVDFDGARMWLHERDRRRMQSPRAPAGVRFLPPGDPYLALRDRATLVPDRALQRKVWRPSGNPGVLLVDGQFTGLWRPEKKAARLTLTLACLASLSESTRSHIQEEAESLAQFRGCTSVEVKYTSTLSFKF